MKATAQSSCTRAHESYTDPLCQQLAPLSLQPRQLRSETGATRSCIPCHGRVSQLVPLVLLLKRVDLRIQLSQSPLQARLESRQLPLAALLEFLLLPLS